MNELNHIPLEEMLMMSFKAFDEGDSILGEKYYKTFEQTKDKALKLAEKAVQAGDTNTVDIIIQSFEKAKALSQERMKENKIKIENQSNIQKNIDIIRTAARKKLQQKNCCAKQTATQK